MAMVYYYAMFAVAMILVLIFAFIFHKHFEPSLMIIAVLVPILNFAFVLMGQAKVIEEALTALRFTYIGGCFLIVAAMFLIFNICGITIKPWVRVVILLVSGAVFSTTITIGRADIFYVGIPDLAFEGGAAYIANKHYGFMHTVFYVLVTLYYIGTVGVIVYSFFRKKQVPRNILILISLAVTVAVFGFFGSRFVHANLELLPAAYNIGLGIYLIIASRLRLYDASDSVTDSLVQQGDKGFISFDHKMRYLGSNATAKEMIPELVSLKIDHHVSENAWLGEHFSPWISEFEQNHENNEHLIQRGEATYLVQINPLVIGKRNRGYQFFISDDTANQEHIRLIQNYNSQLEEEVARKTKHVLEMQEKLVLGMATMVEGRDNSTGGHIKRTSTGVALLLEEMKKDESLGLTEQFCHNLTRAAPMHDLGKVTIDDAILRKPGKFTPEEYEVMKTHAAAGARIVHQILDGTDDLEFHLLAENVAHYHHEKWDGTGYPEGLKGTDIPFEARIMAIADVYDALVSKRVYKERMSFDTAKTIILESMGKHFDPSLEKYFIAALPHLEAYYESVDI